MRRFFIFLKWVFILLAFFVVHAYLTGNRHVFRTLSQTVLQGKLGPGVDTKKLFPSRKINPGTAQKWERSEYYGKCELSTVHQSFLKQYKTLSFVVVKDGKLLYENYNEGYGPASETNIWSVSKSVLSILVGIAIKEGKITGTDQDVSEYLPGYETSHLKIWNLLSSSSGINFRENYFNPYGFPAKALYGTDLKYLCRNYGVNNTPGKYFIYRSGNSQLMGIILEKAIGQKVSEYASNKLWKKIGAERPAYWSLDKPGGMEKTFCCLHTNARDLAKIGQLMLQGGVWNGDTLFSPSYFKNMIHPAPLRELSDSVNRIYGYCWWIDKYKGLDVFYARGINGQYIVCIPAKKMVVVRLGRNWIRDKIGGHHKDYYTYIDAALSLDHTEP
ncbi:MAG: serine hydrolase [Flavobacteriales bacterium]|nr:serine hydrolase [Flavobacteriales bacterium]